MEPSVSLETFSFLKMSNDYISVIPSKIIDYNIFLINEISSKLKINKKIIETINKNLFSECINKKIFGKESYFLGFINHPKLKNYKQFSDITNRYVKQFFKINCLISYHYDFNSFDLTNDRLHNNDYFEFIYYIISVYIQKNIDLVDFVNKKINQLMKLNTKLNKYVNYVSFLNQSEESLEVNNYLNKKLSILESDRIIMKYYPEIKELDYTFEESIGKIINKYHFNNIIKNIYGEYGSNDFIKNNSLRFIFNILNMPQGEYNFIKNKLEMIDYIIEKKIDLSKIENILENYEKIMDHILDHHFNISFYAHRQKIINENFHFMRTMYNELFALCGNKTNEIFTKLLVDKHLGISNKILIFLKKVSTTKTEDLIHL